MTATLPTVDAAPPPAEPVARSSFRPDIEGLRAFAVVLVILDHLVSQPKGGFIGVDVFFVISGFLITGLLLQETERRGRLSFLGFYERRARRILPAAITVLAAVWIASHLAFRGDRVGQTVSDIWWALGFLANAHFAQIGVDYFQATRPPSPVQHFWSLSVEEQFYVVWPIAMFIVLSVIGRLLTPRRARGLLLFGVTAGSVASFVWAVHRTQTRPATAYFSTPVRAWELGLGAIIAIVAVQWPNLASRFGAARGPLSALGLAAIIVSGFIVPSDSGFPAPWAALPDLAAALVLFIGVGGLRSGWLLPLTNPLSRYLGRISYSLYLWHWPVIVIGSAVISKASTVYYPTVITATLGLSVISYHLIESPLRKATFRRQPQVRARDRKARGADTRIAVVAVVVLCIGTGALWAVKPPARVHGFADTGKSAVADVPLDPSVVLPTPVRKAAITTALDATHWPTLNPSLDQLTIKSALKQWGGCKETTKKKLAGCTFGKYTSPSKVAVVVGDSYAMAWMPTFSAGLVPRGWIVYGLSAGECPAADISVLNEEKPPTPLPTCDDHHQWVVPLVNSLKPSLVILASADNTLARLASKATGNAAGAQYQAGLEQAIRGFKPSATRHVLTVSPPPTGAVMQSCDSSGSAPGDCVKKIKTPWRTFAVAEKAAAAATGTAYADTHLWFCDQAGYCPSFVGNTPVRWDGSHITENYARSLGPEAATLVTKVMSGS